MLYYKIATIRDTAPGGVHHWVEETHSGVTLCGIEVVPTELISTPIYETCPDCQKAFSTDEGGKPERKRHYATEIIDRETYLCSCGERVTTDNVDQHITRSDYDLEASYND